MQYPADIADAVTVYFLQTVLLGMQNVVITVQHKVLHSYKVY